LNNIRDTQRLVGMQMLNDEGKRIVPHTVINAGNMDMMSEKQITENLNALWKNFCISATYEPGSVSKPFTVAAALESGSITGEETYRCDGKLTVGEYDIACNVKYGHGDVTVGQAVAVSCNVAMMKIGMATGRDNFVDFQRNFNFGLKTNVDLEGEARTVGLVYDKTNMRLTELATCSFGQGFNATMIQMIAGFCSLVNGGNYYEPHLVSKIISPSGSTVENIEPRLLKQTISQETSDTIRQFCVNAVCGEGGTGRTARPAGYLIGGKTGTAEMVPRDKTNYVVSFMGFAPSDEPQIAIYCVVDRPNAQLQADAKRATRIVRGILTEVLPYLNIHMTEELSEEEMEELAALQLEILSPITPSGSEEEGEEGEEGEAGDEDGENGEDEELPAPEEIWRSFPIDMATGYRIDPETGEYLDAATGASVGGSFISAGFDILPPVGGTDDGPP
ncbi:MAG: cell division protein FtsI, partial [Lachnospiraceae bacterium]|nr:cell division protein FtsI [Lachnospiraceae bacterium]